MTNQITNTKQEEAKEEKTNLVNIIKSSYEANSFTDDMQAQAVYQTNLVLKHLQENGTDIKKIDNKNLALDCLNLLTCGLNIAPQSNHVYWIPRETKRGSGVYKVSPVVRREGFVHLLDKDGYIVETQAVYKNDEFEADFNNHSVLHKVKFLSKEERGELVGVYAIIKSKSNTNIGWLEVMNAEELDIVKSKSDGLKKWDDNLKKKVENPNSPWFQFTSEMAKKTVIRRCAKNISTSPELLKLVEIDNQDYSFKDATPEAPSLSGAVEKEVDLKILAKAGE